MESASPKRSITRAEVVFLAGLVALVAAWIGVWGFDEPVSDQEEAAHEEAVEIQEPLVAEPEAAEEEVVEERSSSGRYHNAKYGFSLNYPPGYMFDESFPYETGGVGYAFVQVGVASATVEFFDNGLTIEVRRDAMTPDERTRAAELCPDLELLGPGNLPAYKSISGDESISIERWSVFLPDVYIRIALGNNVKYGVDQLLSRAVQTFELDDPGRAIKIACP